MKKTQSNSKKSGIKPVSLLVTCWILACLFVFFYAFIMPMDFDNLGGKHVWVSGSTIKYVNMWLEEGAYDLHFTNYECFPSIELPAKADRLPYVSYPTGVTFMVWSAAKICGRNHIDISFLKHYQLILYGLEVMMMGAIVYALTAVQCRIKEWVKILISVAAGAFWLSIPVNNWFLSNIFWTDIAVVFWILAFLLLESLEADKTLGKKTKKIILTIKCMVIYAGVMTEYYFWIVVFMAFVFNFIRIWPAADKNKVKKSVISSLQYVIPVVVALVTYLWQMSAVEGWLQQLEDTFLHRTGASAENEASMQMFIKNATEALTYGSITRACLLVPVEILSIILFVVTVLKKGTIKKGIDNKAICAVIILYLSPIIQICIFGNHSAIHQYAMVKVGFHILAMYITIVGCSLYLSKSRTGIFISRTLWCISAILIFLAMGYPTQVVNYYYQKNTELDYSIDEAIKKNTNYEDVCFSYTYEIADNPPMDICVSEKMVYLIDSSDDVKNKLAGLGDEANAVLVIDKHNIGSNNMKAVPQKTSQIEKAEAQAIEEGEVFYEDDMCIMVRINR